MDPPLISGLLFFVIVTGGGLVAITGGLVVPGWHSVLNLVLLVSVVVVSVHCQYESGFHCCVRIDCMSYNGCVSIVLYTYHSELLSWLW